MKFNYFILLDGKYPRLNLSAAGSTRHFAKGSNIFHFLLLAPKMIFSIMLFIPINASNKEKMNCPDHSRSPVSSMHRTKDGHYAGMTRFPIFPFWESNNQTPN